MLWLDARGVGHFDRHRAGAGGGLVGGVGELPAGARGDLRACPPSRPPACRRPALRRRSPAGPRPCRGGPRPWKRRRRCPAGSSRSTRSLGIAPSGLGSWICPSTTPRTVLRSRPSSMLARKASSRFGPTMPLVPAWASVWQEPHFATKAFLPAIRLALSPPLTLPQPEAASAVRTIGACDPSAGRSAADPPPARRGVRETRVGSSSEGGTLSEGAVGPRVRRPRRAGAQGRCSPSSSPCPAAITPAATRSQDQRSRTVATRPALACSSRP